MEQNWKTAVSHVSEKCPTLSFGDRSKIASELWELQKAERDALRAQRDSELEELRTMKLAEQQRLRDLQNGERQYARIERAVFCAIFLIAGLVGLASCIAVMYQATYGHRECQARLEDLRTGTQQRARDFAADLAEIRRLTQRLAL